MFLLHLYSQVSFECTGLFRRLILSICYNLLYLKLPRIKDARAPPIVYFIFSCKFMLIHVCKLYYFLNLAVFFCNFGFPFQILRLALKFSITVLYLVGSLLTAELISSQKVFNSPSGSYTCLTFYKDFFVSLIMTYVAQIIMILKAFEMLLLKRLIPFLSYNSTLNHRTN